MADIPGKKTTGMNERRERLLRFIHEIPIFASLAPQDAARVLARAHQRSLDEGERLCCQGDASDELYILLSGRLSVRIKHSATIATIHPVSSIGELGVFTGQPRSATVEAMIPSTVLVLAKNDLDAIVSENPVLGVGIMRNVIALLAGRIAEDNIKLREYQQYIIDQMDSGSGS
jgi:CRP-like cAMP-binding protein